MQEIVGRRISKLCDTIFDIINGKPGSTHPQNMPEDARLCFQTFIEEHCNILGNQAQSGSSRPWAFENRSWISDNLGSVIKYVHHLTVELATNPRAKKPRFCCFPKWKIQFVTINIWQLWVFLKLNEQVIRTDFQLRLPRQPDSEVTCKKCSKSCSILVGWWWVGRSLKGKKIVYLCIWGSRLTIIPYTKECST